MHLNLHHRCEATIDLSTLDTYNKLYHCTTFATSTYNTSPTAQTIANTSCGTYVQSEGDVPRRRETALGESECMGLSVGDKDRI